MPYSNTDAKQSWILMKFNVPSVYDHVCKQNSFLASCIYFLAFVVLWDICVLYISLDVMTHFPRTFWLLHTYSKH